MLLSKTCDFLYTSEFSNRLLLLLATNGVCDFALSTTLGWGWSNKPFVLFTTPYWGPDLDIAFDKLAVKVPNISFPLLAFN